MTTNHRTFVKARAIEIKILYVLVLLGILGSAWLLHDAARLALLELHLLIL